MKPILTASEKDLQLTIDLQPAWITVGYGQSKPGSAFNAAVAVGYDRTQLPLVKSIINTMRAQKRDPSISIYQDTVQIGFSTSPVESTCRDFIMRLSLLSEITGDISHFNVSSMGEIFPEDDSYKVFEKCYKRDRFIQLVLMDAGTAQIGDHGGHGEPFDMFIVKELASGLQLAF